jgi:hypothetical protein
MRLLVVVLALSGCGAVDPCDGHGGGCLSLRIENGGGVSAVDQLAIRLSGAARLDGSTPSAPRQSVTLPVATAIYLPDSAAGSVDVTVRGLRAGKLVGLGAAVATVAPRTHTTLTVTLAPPATIVADLGELSDGLPATDALDALFPVDAHDAAPPPPDLLLPPRYVFVLPVQSSALPAESVLDTMCTDAASAAQLPSRYRALIAYPNVNPRDVLVLNQGRSIILPDSSPVATDASFFSTTHLGPIDETAGRQKVSGCVFTDFNYNGDRISAAQGDCNGWTSNMSGSVAYVGDVTRSDGQWSFASPSSCAALFCHVYCIQQ